MGKSILLVAALTLATPPGAGSVAGAAPLACDVNFRLRNDLSGAVTVSWEKSQVRTRWGFWSRIAQGETSVGRGDTRTVTQRVDLGCNAHRRYRLLITSAGRGSVYHYLPGEKSFTQSNDLTVRMSEAF